MPQARFFLPAGSYTGDFPGSVPTFTASITETSLTVGQTASLTVNGPVSSRQWRLNGGNISGATGATYVTAAAGSLDCIVTPLGVQPQVTTAAVTVAAAPSGFSDDFDRADGAIGSNWTSVQGAATLVIVSNQARLGATVSQAVRWRFTPAGLSGNVFAQVTYVTEANGGGQKNILIFGSDDASYEMNYQAPTDVRIVRRTSGGTATVLAQEATGALTNGDVMRIEVTDVDANTVRIRGFRNGSQVITVDDTSGSRISGTKRGGIGSFFANTTGQLFFNNFSFGAV